MVNAPRGGEGGDGDAAGKRFVQVFVLEGRSEKVCDDDMSVLEARAEADIDMAASVEFAGRSSQTQVFGSRAWR